MVAVGCTIPEQSMHFQLFRVIKSFQNGTYLLGIQNVETPRNGCETGFWDSPCAYNNPES